MESKLEVSSATTVIRLTTKGVAQTALAKCLVGTVQTRITYWAPKQIQLVILFAETFTELMVKNVMMGLRLIEDVEKIVQLIQNGAALKIYS
jgi:hypothetical protein